MSHLSHPVPPTPPATPPACPSAVAIAVAVGDRERDCDEAFQSHSELGQMIHRIETKIDHRLEHYAPVTWVNDVFKRLEGLVRSIDQAQGQTQACVGEMQKSQHQQAQAITTITEKIGEVFDVVEDVMKQQATDNAELSALKRKGEEEKQARERERQEQALVGEKERNTLLQEQLKNSNWKTRITNSATFAGACSVWLVLIAVVFKLLLVGGPHLVKFMEAMYHVAK